MKIERNGKFYFWRWTWGYLRVTSFHSWSSFRLYHGNHWWSLWFNRFNIDWDSTFDALEDYLGS